MSCYDEHGMLEAADDRLAEAEKRISELEAEIAALRRERDDAVRAAWAVRDLATPPISDADVERAVAEAKRVMEDLEDAGDPFQLR